MIQRLAAQAIVRLYDPAEVTVVADPGFMSYDSVARNFSSMPKSRQSFTGTTTLTPTSVTFSGERPESAEGWVFVPGLDGAILRPYIVSTDSNFSVFNSSGNYNDYYSDNDPWGHYYEFNNANQGHINLYSPEDNKGGYGMPTIAGNPCFAVRIRKYEAASGTETNVLEQKGAYTQITFGGIWAIRIPYSGTSMLYKQGEDKTWEEVKGLSYIPDSRSAVDAIDLLVMNLSGKLIISSDWLKSADIYEEAYSLQMLPQPVVLANRGARCQVAIRKVRFQDRGAIVLEKNLKSYIRLIDPIALEVELEANSYVKADIGYGIRCYHFSDFIGGYTASIECFDSGKTYAILNVPGGWTTPIFYGFMLKIRPNVAVGTNSFDGISSDTFNVTLDCPMEEENTKATITMKSIGRVTKESGRKTYKYADIKNLYPYMYASVLLGHNVVNTDGGDPYFELQRQFNGITKDISLTQSGNFDCTISTAIVQLQETTCDGNWGPYDGTWAVEAAENVCWECGIPPSGTGIPGVMGGFWIKGYKTGGYDQGGNPVPEVQRWFTVQQALADPLMLELLTQLPIGADKDPKFKPRPGDNGWSVLQSIAAYENALVYVDGLNIIYDPFYNNEIGFRKMPYYGGGGQTLYHMVREPYDYNDDFVDLFSARDYYDTYKQAAPVDAQLVSDRLAKSIVVVGQRVAGGSKQALLAAAVNPYDSGKNIPFPKRITMVLPQVDNMGILLTLLSRLETRLFQVPRDFNLTVPGSAYLKARQIVSYTDHNVEGSLDTEEPVALIKLTGANHVWNSSGEGSAWGKTILSGMHFGTAGGLAFEVQE